MSSVATSFCTRENFRLPSLRYGRSNKVTARVRGNDAERNVPIVPFRVCSGGTGVLYDVEEDPGGSIVVRPRVAMSPKRGAHAGSRRRLQLPWPVGAYATVPQIQPVRVPNGTQSLRAELRSAPEFVPKPYRFRHVAGILGPYGPCFLRARARIHRSGEFEDHLRLPVSR